MPPELGDLASAAASAAAPARGRGQRGAATGAASGADARPSLLGGTTAFTPVDIPVVGGGFDGPRGDFDGGAPFGASDRRPRPPEEALPEGARIEYWYNPDYSWISATVKRSLRSPKGQLLHTLHFDVDDTVEDVSLTFGDGNKRWRPLRQGA